MADHWSEPDGCKWCGIERRNHGMCWAEEVGMHLYASPSNQQRKTRMTARRARNKRTN